MKGRVWSHACKGGGVESCLCEGEGVGVTLV